MAEQNANGTTLPVDRLRTRLRTIVATALAAGAVAAVAWAPVAQAAPTVFAPAKYANVTPADKAFLRLVHGWANRINTRNADWGRCKTEVCNRDRVRHLASVGFDAAFNVRFALKHGARPLYKPPTTRCVRVAGSQFAHVGARANKLDGFFFGTGAQARFDAAQRAYVSAVKRANRTAKACQRATAR